MKIRPGGEIAVQLPLPDEPLAELIASRRVQCTALVSSVIESTVIVAARATVPLLIKANAKINPAASRAALPIE
jgi:hypothetical protein